MTNLKKILQILSDGNFHSGETLGKKLTLTRSAIWKLIKKIKQLGIEIESKTNLGYRIVNGLELLDKKNIISFLSKENNESTKHIAIFDELTSTNTYLEQQQNLSDVSIVFAEYQSVGKGRLGRKWNSPFGQNIYLSIRANFSKNVTDLSCLSLVAAITVIQTLNAYGISNDIGIKWPNDILWQGKKLAGVLVEVFGELHHAYTAIIGIGLNVMMSKPNLSLEQSWCDIFQITNSVPKRNKLAGLLLNQLLLNINKFQEAGFKPFIELWEKYDLVKGKTVTLISGAKKISGIALGIDNNGRFLLQDSKGNILSFTSGEVSLRF